MDGTYFGRVFHKGIKMLPLSKRNPSSYVIYLANGYIVDLWNMINVLNVVIVIYHSSVQSVLGILTFKTMVDLIESNPINIVLFFLLCLGWGIWYEPKNVYKNNKIKGLKNILVKKMVGQKEARFSKEIMCKKNTWVHKDLGSKCFWSKKFYVQKKLFERKIIRTKKVYLLFHFIKKTPYKIFLVPKSQSTRKFWLQKDFGSKNWGQIFNSKCFGHKEFLDHKDQKHKTLSLKKI